MMIREFSCFTGYGGSTWALKKAGIPHEVVGWSEIDKQAIRCYQQNFPEYKNLNYGDISEIYKLHLPDHDLLTGGFPCQDVSIAGKRDLEKGRTNLYKEMVEIARIKKPKYILMENVAGLLSMRSKGRLLIDIIVNDFKSLGYGVAWKVLNSCDYGIPQSKRRIWIACKLGGWDFMKPNWNFRKIKGKIIADILEPEVDEKYYLSEKQVKKLLESADLDKQFSTLDADIAGTQTGRQYANWRGNFVSAVLTPERMEKRQNGRRFKKDGEPMFTLSTQDRHGILQLNRGARNGERLYSENGVSPTIASNSGGITNDRAILQLNNPSHSNDRIYSENGLSPTLNTMQGGNRQPFIHNLQPRSKDRPSIRKALEAGKPAPGSSGHLKRNDGKTYTISTNADQGVELQGRIRKLTPRECFRLQGFMEEEINLEGFSDSALYKMAGNGWEINVASLVLRSMLREEG